MGPEAGDGGAGGAGAGGGDDEAARARSLALLEATHEFPGEYTITVIAFNREQVTEALRREAGVVAAEESSAGDADAAAGASGSGRHQTRASREGKYLSHRFSLLVQHAGEVLELYARLKAIDGVVTIL